MSAFALFDFADTLAELQPRRQDIVADYIDRVGNLRVEAEVVARACKAVDLLRPYSSLTIRTNRERSDFYGEYNRRIFDFLGVTHLADSAGLMAAFNERKAHWTLKKGALNTLHTLRQRGYRIGIISNFDSRLEQIVYEHLNLGDLVEYLHISQTERMEKPDPRFYLKFFERHQLSIETATYVGDSYTLDFLPATGINLKVRLLDEAGLYRHLPEAISSIGDLPQLLP